MKNFKVIAIMACAVIALSSCEQEEIQEPLNDQPISLDADRGVYLLVCSSDKRTVTKKLIVQ